MKLTRSALLVLAAVLVLASEACVRHGFSRQQAIDDGAANGDDGAAIGDDGAAIGDAVGDSAPSGCSWRGDFTFSTPTPIEELNSAEADAEPFVTADGLTIYFASSRGGSERLQQWVAERASRDAPFGEPRRVFEGSEGETHLSMTPDGLTVFISAYWSGGQGTTDIWIAERASADAGLLQADFVPLTQANSDGWEFDPFPSADGQRLYFGIRPLIAMPLEQRVYLLERAAGGVFGSPRLLDGVGTLAGKTDNPVVTPDERVIVFGRKLAEADTMDVWYALGDPQKGAGFGDARPVPGVNRADADDHQLYLSPDGCRLVFCSDRPGGKGGLDLYRADYIARAP